MSDRLLGWVLIVCGVVGAVAAFVLSVEKVALLEDPSYVPSCSINPILSCGSVMKSGQAEVFGFPNPLIGLLTFPVVIVTGLLSVAGVRLPRWWWRGLQIGISAALLFVHWLIFQSLYRINALCPYCMAVWVVVVVAFTYVTLGNWERGYLGQTRGATRVARVHSVVPTIWLLVITSLIGVRFWAYWRTII